MCLERREPAVTHDIPPSSLDLDQKAALCRIGFACRLVTNMILEVAYTTGQSGNSGSGGSGAKPRHERETDMRLAQHLSAFAAGVTSVTGRARATSGGASSEGQSADFASLPSEARIPYTRDSGGLLMIDASINNRSMKMFFDTYHCLS